MNTTFIDAAAADENEICNGLHCKTATQLCLTIVSIAIIAIGIYGNGIICLLVYQKPSMRSAINILLAVLAATDFTIVVCSVTISTLTLLTNDLMKWTLGSQTLCDAHSVIYLWFLIVNATVLTIISVDRYIIITKRREFLTRLKVKRSIFLIVILALFFALASLMPPMRLKYVAGSTKCVLANATRSEQFIYVTIAYALTFLVPLLVMSFTCGNVVFAVKKNYARINLFGDSEIVYKISPEVRKYKYCCQPRVDLRFKTRTFYNVAILCLIFVVCRGPYCTYMLFTNFQGSFSPFVHVLLLWLSYLNPALNSLICIWRIRKFRQRFLMYFSYFCYCGDFEIKPSLRVKPSSVSSDQFNANNNCDNSI